MHDVPAGSVSATLLTLIRQAISEAGGWLPFDRFMALALYEPGLGYYAHGSRKFGSLPQSGSDFVTAPELSPHFGHTLAVPVAQALKASQTDEVWEFGAGSGALAEQLLDGLAAQGLSPSYTIVDLSSSLRERQQTRLARFGDRVRWVHALPEALDGVVVGNEVLDAMPVQLLHFDGAQWLERGVGCAPDGTLVFVDRPTDLQPPVAGPFVPGTVTEVHLQAEAFVRTLADRLRRGAAYFIDYGFPESEYYHPQRTGGTLMCHRAHQADDNPLVWVGEKDITAHVNFTGIAMAGQDGGFDVLGYTSQAHFLLNCGLLDRLPPDDIRARAAILKLVNEHEMGELFKVIGFARGCDDGFVATPPGFERGDRSHTL